MRRRTYTDDSFTSAETSSSSWAQVLRKLNLKPGGTTYVQIQLLAKKLELDTSHMRGKAWNTGDRYRKIAEPRPLDEVLVKDRLTQTHHLKKKRLWTEGLLEKRCSSCGSREWFGRTNHLQPDHIDGDRLNNTLENLRILCANCHSLTNTYCGKNTGRVSQQVEETGSKPVKCGFESHRAHEQ